MKIKHLLLGLLIPTVTFWSCYEPDDLVRTDSENVTTLSVKGRFVSDESLVYDATIDEVNNIITVNVPYYISDTEKIQGDLTQMKLSATLPVGARFEPGIAGIHDLSNGFSPTLINEDGTRVEYTIKAEYVKSSSAKILSATLSNFPRATISLVDPEDGGGTGVIKIYKTTSSIDGALKSASLQLSISPWATSDLASDAAIDLSSSKTITITAQDGTVVKYVTEIVTPASVPEGQIGYISLLFGFQPTGNNTMGFKVGENRSLAVVGDYLIMSSTSLNFVVYDRYSGEYLENKKVNTTGVLDGVIHAITSDDNETLVAITYAAVNNPYVSNSMFEIYVWKDGIDNPPIKIYSKDVATDNDFAQFRSFSSATAYDVGRTVGLRGDIVSGTAQLMTASYQKTCVVRLKIVNGSVVGTPIAESKGISTVAKLSKPIPVDTEDVPIYVMGSADSKKIVCYVNQDRTSIVFSPNTSWWTSDIKGIAYTEFNGIKMVAVQNGYYTSAGADAYNRLCVENINSMSANAFNTSQIADFRLQNYDPSVTTTSNSTLTGMTSYYVSAANGGSIGTNANKTGDVCFGRSQDGTAVQVYMLTTDHGIIAYEITKFNL